MRYLPSVEVGDTADCVGVGAAEIIVEKSANMAALLLEMYMSTNELSSEHEVKEY